MACLKHIGGGRRGGVQGVAEHGGIGAVYGICGSSAGIVHDEEHQGSTKAKFVEDVLPEFADGVAVLFAEAEEVHDGGEAVAGKHEAMHKMAANDASQLVKAAQGSAKEMVHRAENHGTGSEHEHATLLTLSKIF